MGTDTVQNHCSEYSYVDDLCIRKTNPTHMKKHTDPHTYEHDTVPEGDVGSHKESLCDNL